MLIPRSRSFSLLHLAVPVLLFAALLSASPSWAEEAPSQPSDLLLILDASGSMWGQIEGENKIVIARRVVGEMIDGFSDDQRVGLIAYGHRREGDCEDIEVVAPMGPLDRSALKATVDALNPKGKTPITASLKKALEVVRNGQGGTTLILVSDGLETCGGDPCATVKAAKKEGLNLLLHVVGFDVAKEDVSQLECAAQAGGGQFLTAENADQLSLALQAATALTVDTPAGGLSLKAVTNGELQDVLIKVAKSGEDSLFASARSYVSPETNPRFMPLAPGEYTVSVQAVGLKGDIDRKLDISIGEDEVVERELDFSTGELKVGATQNEALLDATVGVFIAGTNTDVASGRTYNRAKSNPKTFNLTPGTYDVQVKAIGIGGDPTQRWEGVVIEPRGTTTLTHAFNSGTLRLGVSRGDQLIDATVNIINTAKNRSEGGGRTYTSASSNPKEFKLMPGDYRVKVLEVKGDGAEREFNVEIKADEVEEVLLDLDAAGNS